jgi:hypothetical protein
MRREEDERLRQVYQYRCGYCGVSEQDCGAKLTIDHFQPRSRNGAHEPANWVYCCHACNEFRSDSWSPDSPHRILHPLREDVTAHIVEQDDGTLRAVTQTGTFHIETLNLNRPQLIAFRSERRRRDAARAAQTQLLARLENLEQQLQMLILRLAQLESDRPGT